MDQKTIVNYRWGLFWSFMSAFLWATVYVVSRVMLGSEGKQVADPVTLSLMRFAMGGAILFCICLALYRKELFALKARDYLMVALLSQFSVVGMSVFVFWGLSYTEAINSSMIMSCSPILIMLFGLFIGNKITAAQVGGIVICTVGCLMVLMTGQGDLHYSWSSLKGDLLVFIAATFWAIGAILAKKLVTVHHDMAVTAWSMIFASASLLIINLFRSNYIIMPQDTSGWLLVLYLGVFPTAVGFYAWNAALNRVSLHIVNIMQYLTPLMTFVLAWAFLGESVTLLKILGAVMVVGGVAFVSRNKAAETGKN
jgi:drug/metabolite transporter (DMT)-like permease